MYYLFLAEDTSTALLEMLGVQPENISDGLTGKELAIAGNFSHFVIQGCLGTVLDLTKPETLKRFYNTIAVFLDGTKVLKKC